jgi:NADH:ubiquinone oxidoreductase subunit F (NADH-binding)
MKQNRTMVLSETGRELRGRDGGGYLTNIKCKAIWNYHNESPLYHEYILIKKKKKEKESEYG